MRLGSLVLCLALVACAPDDMGGVPAPAHGPFDRATMRFEPVDIGVEGHLTGVWSGGVGRVWVVGRTADPPVPPT